MYRVPMAMFLAGALAAGGRADTPYTPEVESPAYSNTIARARAHLLEAMAANGVPGASVVLVDGQEVVWAAGFGVSDLSNRTPATAGTVFGIGSVSKTFTAAAVMQQVEQGRLDLDAPLAAVLPAFAMRERFPGSGPVTLRTILDHHSGIPADMLNGAFTSGAEWPGFPDSLLEALREDYPAFPINTVWSYDNSGYCLLPLAVEAVSGRTWKDDTETFLFDAMGMTNTSYYSDPSRIGAHPRSFHQGVEYPAEYCNLTGAGSVLSTARDMGRYLRMLLAGGLSGTNRILEAATLDRMLTGQTRLPLDEGGPVATFGLGWGVEDPSLAYAGRVAAHAGATVFFHAYTCLLPDRKLGVFMVCNGAAVGDCPTASAQLCLREALAEKTGLTNTPAEPPDAAVTNWPLADLQAVTGLYVTASGYDLITLQTGQLALILDAHTAAPVPFPLVPRTNGRLTRPDSLASQLAITNLLGRTLAWLHIWSGGVAYRNTLGERYTPGPIPDAWRGRLGRYHLVNLRTNDFNRLLPPELALVSPAFRLEERLGMIGLGFGEPFLPVQPTNDVLGFVPGLAGQQGRGRDIAVQAHTNGPLLLQFRSGLYARDLAPWNDADGDGASDLAVWHAASGQWFVRSAVTSQALVWAAAWGGPGMTPAPGDYDGDSRSDLAVYDPPNGRWYLQGSSGAFMLWAAAWGGPGLVPVPGDYDADGRSDLAVYDGAQGRWYAQSPAGGILVWGQAWGGPGLVPVPGDYDADGRSDLAVYDGAQGRWYAETVTGSNLFWEAAWGGPGFLPVPGDFDGDRVSDLAVYDPRAGQWFIRRTDGSLLAWAVPWGGPGWQAVPGDFDGDGTGDLALYAESAGEWWVYSLSRGITLEAMPWGGPGFPAVTPGH